MSIDVPVAGAPILDTWGADVAGQLNRHVPLTLTAAQASNSATGQAVNGMSFAVTAGKVYHVRIFGGYQCSATNQGLQLGFIAAGCTGVLAVRIWGAATSATTETRYRSAGTLIGAAAVTAAASNREFWADAWFSCATTGTWALSFARGGTSGSTGVTLQAGTGGIAVASA